MCEYCEDGKLIVNADGNGLDGGVMKIVGTELFVNWGDRLELKGPMFVFEIDSCPMCGRDLRWKVDYGITCGADGIAPLLPCPFCGSNDLSEGPHSPYVICNGCGAFGPGNSDVTHERAVEAWNTRAAVTDHDERDELIRDMCEWLSDDAIGIFAERMKELGIEVSA